MNTLTAEQQKAGMSLTVYYARHLEVTHKHQFGDGQFSKAKDYPGPKRARSCQYYLDCRNCGRAVFEDGKGSAAESHCGAVGR